MKKLKYLLFFLLISSFGIAQENNSKIEYNWNIIEKIKLIEIDQTIDLKNYEEISRLFDNKKEISKRDMVELRALLKFNNCCDVIIEKRKILMNVEFKNESVIFLIHFNQSALFDLRPNKFNFLIINNKLKFQKKITQLLLK